MSEVISNLKIDDNVRVSVSKTEKGNEIAHVTFNVPMSFKLCGARPLKEYEEIIIENIGNKVQMIFKLIDFLGHMYDQDEIMPEYYSDFCQQLSQIGGSLAESVEVIQLAFERHSKYDSPYIVNSKEPIEVLISRCLKHPQVTSGFMQAVGIFLRENNKKPTTDLLEFESPEFIKTALLNDIGEYADGTPMSDEDFAKVGGKKPEGGSEKLVNLAKTVHSFIKDKNIPREAKKNVYRDLQEMMTCGIREKTWEEHPEFIRGLLSLEENKGYEQQLIEDMEGVTQ